MIPTREQIKNWTGTLPYGWLCAMRDEIDRLTAELAGDGKALRELRAWIIDEKWCAPGIVRKIDEMLAQPEPSTVYSRGKTIAESADPPTAYYPPPPVEIWPEEMKRQTLVGKFEPAPVEQPAPPAAAVPDDTRELVAQLADVAAEFFVAPWCDRAKAIAAKLRGGA